MGKRTEKDLAAQAPVSDGVQAYIDALRRAPDSKHVLIGMVKAAEATDGVMVAHIGNCRRWAHIPALAIKAIRGNGRVACGSHSHTVAEIHLKEPNSDLETAFANIANLHLSRLDDMQTKIAVGDGGAPCGPGEHWGQDQYGNWGCQPGD